MYADIMGIRNKIARKTETGQINNQTRATIGL
jgi:hypothetical protein